MYLRQTLRLYKSAISILKKDKRFYSNRNVLLLHERGMYQDMFPDISSHEIEKLLVGSPQCVYSGFDPTADSLHVGNLLVLMNLLNWQRSGHQVIALVGGATGQIGDPSFRTNEREEINATILSQNVDAIKQNIKTIFNNHEKYLWNKTNSIMKPPIIMNNADWYQDLNIIDFMKKIGKHFRLGTMMGRASVQSRLNSKGGMSFSEFSYQIFQAYDWLYLMNKYNCRFQIGGNDQMGNIVSGHDLISRSTGKKVYGLTLPLITQEGGKKLGKSVGNPIWLSSTKSSCFKFYQFFIRTIDADVERFLKLFTFLSINEINEIMKCHLAAPEKREAQRILADQITLLVHGETGLESAKLASSLLYNNSIPSLTKLNAHEIMNILDGEQLIELQFKPGLTIHELCMQINCFKSNEDAMRIIPAGGFYMNHSRVTNLNEVITPGIHILSNDVTLIRIGKKTYHIVKWYM